MIDISSSSLASIFPNVCSNETLPLLLAAAPAKSNSGSETTVVPKDGPVVTPNQAYILRAAAIDACELIVEVAHSLDIDSFSSESDALDWIREITLPDLDMWIWAVAKDRTDYRQLERFVQRDTVFF